MLKAGKNGGDWISPTSSRELRRRLSPRQEEVLKLIAEGCRTIEIAHVLGIKPETVNQHTHKLRTKLSARTNAHAVAIFFGVIVVSGTRLFDIHKQTSE